MFSEITGPGVVRVHEVNGASCDQIFTDRFGNRTPIRSVPIKGMSPAESKTLGPGKATAEHRPSAGRIARGRGAVDKIAG